MVHRIDPRIKFRDVFHHVAQHTEQLRTAIVGDIGRYVVEDGSLASSRRPFRTDLLLEPELYMQLKPTYTALLYHGSLNRRELADELIWKWTEATGKYVGCPYWSVRAKSLFDEVAATFKEKLSLTEAVKLADRLSAKGLESRIIHEHVYPRGDLRKLLRRPGANVRDLLERLGVSCVVLGSEDRAIARGGIKCEENPWKRYTATEVKLVDNPEWPKEQRDMITDAGLLA
jgi:hypothetical protein